MPDPYSIKIFMPSGEPNGLRILERPNWTGSGMAFSRTGFDEAKTRSELDRAGVYILVGDLSNGNSFPTLYIGEGDPVLDRLKNHNANKDFWTSAIVFTSKDTNFNKAHIKHLESRLIEIALKAKLCKLENLNSPTKPSLSEADYADTEQFLENLLRILPLLGLSVFEEAQNTLTVDEATLFLQGKNIKASAVQQPSGFIVLKGSEASINNTNSCQPSYIQKRVDMLSSGLLVEKEDKLIFTENVTFTSPSYASSVVLGRSTNGLDLWKDKLGKTLKKLQSEDSLLTE